MKQTIKFGKARLARFNTTRVDTYSENASYRTTVRASVVRVKSL